MSSAGSTVCLVDDLHRRSEASRVASREIRSIGHVEACHNVVSAWLGLLWNHEPVQSTGEAKVAVV